MKELEDYKYALEWIANSDVWFDFENPKSIDEVYNECVRIASLSLEKYEK